MPQHQQLGILGRFPSTNHPTVLGALIAVGGSLVGTGIAFLTARYSAKQMLAAENTKRLWERRAEIYVQVIACAHHREASREHQLKGFRFDEAAEANIQALLDSYTPTSWFDLYAQMRAFASDTVLAAFLAAFNADDEIRCAAGNQAATAAAATTAAELAHAGVLTAGDPRAAAQTERNAAATVKTPGEQGHRRTTHWSPRSVRNCTGSDQCPPLGRGQWSVRSSVTARSRSAVRCALTVLGAFLATVSRYTR